MNNDIIIQKHFHTQAVIKWKQDDDDDDEISSDKLFKFLLDYLKYSNVHLLIVRFPHFKSICLVISLTRRI